MMRVLFFFALFLFVLSLIDTVSAQCADGSSPFNCLVRPCNANSCKKGIDFCVDDYCGGCNAKCQCSANSDCFDGQQCQSGFCVAVSTTAAPSSCPSTVETSECVCSHLGKYWAVGGFFDGCNSCQCTEDKRVFCTKKLCPIIPTDQPTEEPSPITTSTPVDTCVITNNDFSTCQNGITPCAVVRCGFGGECIAHRCGTENNQCQAICSCGDDSHCASGQICAANEFGIKVCKADTNQECPDGRPGVRCFAAPCSVLSSDRQCKKGADFCLNDYCGGCNANCQCDSNSDCYSDQECKADWKGKKICQATAATTTTRAPTTPAPTTSPSSKVCISNLDCRRGERCDFPFWFSLFGRCVPRTTRPPTTTTPRPAQCEYNGRIFQSGDSFPSADGCNNCFCNENGVIGCTKKACTCPAGQGFASCKAAPCDMKSCKTGLCTNDYCGGCYAKCRCERDNDCQQGEICQLDQSGWNHCVAKPTTTTTTTTRKPSRTTTSTAPATTACAGKVCPAILCANRAPCKYQCGINYCSCTDYCKCKNNSHCESNERCEIASGETEGKCVNKNRPLLSKLDKF